MRTSKFSEEQKVLGSTITGMREEGLQLHERDLQRFFDRTPDLIFAEQGGKIIYTNAAFVRAMRGGDAKSFLGRPVTSLIAIQHTKHSARPNAHATTLERWLVAVRRYRAIVVALRDAAHLWLAGDFDAEFPKHCFRPPAWIVN
jgi:PAS domain-containing protein